MPQLTSKTITDPEAYVRVLEEVRSTGYATDMGESEEGACCVAVSLGGHASRIHAAISLSSPAQRFPMDDVLGIVNGAAGGGPRGRRGAPRQEP